MPFTPMYKHLAGRVCAGLACAWLTACAGAGEPATPAVSGVAGTASAAAANSAGPPFHNNYNDFGPRGFGELLRWRWNAFREDLPKPPQAPTPSVAPDLAFITANARAGAAMQPAATWLGHASVLLQMGGLNVLADPIFSERASPLGWVGPKRAQPAGLTLAQLPHVDLVVVSHNHYDHCDLPSLQALNAQAAGPPLFLVPRGVKAWLHEQGITNVVELDWWQQHTLGALRIVFTPVQHWAGRSLTDRMDTRWGGWALLAPDFSAFFAGDTGYSRDFADIQQRLGDFDLALIPVGAYEPRWFMSNQHVNPDESVRIHRDLHARQSIGIHWGTFQLTDESLDEPPRALAAARAAQGVAEDAFVVLAIGQTKVLSPRPGRTMSAPAP